ncbi:acyl-CoA dehydrogenase family protein [Pseudonocardia sp. KRD-184]|uniref:Acyl-CoA dehydrogenase family protein n=1 Tax=Pseudonocardia oceani TaxID=2792013 RepID=A0ABS6UEH9_9PSEU|nr:acyl-CoA dehydrogenase family protein [Pseudonocardia oceani]MBW0091199.1 acyl-CoA dehydrogenase family protein [Pseudonocardia oceani]MBW0098282.1 acyl-CoA dehydrogenase family protein [Pseudonocardia oceani]MBW0110835.1 acyl-CoA dehydrogenase family protein [Pseudonocardia oceani]MBW0121696.1 acyl-CoA dehydrogenase family protein [Pseudonocardia oceani]MBW0130658.1 acyl-CoA dehydrogenase family protein [Pseudonocardia oceani]
MAVDLAPEPAVAELVTRTAQFVRDVVVPVEVANDGVVPSESVRRELQAAAKAAGVFAPHVSPEYGGHGLDMCARAAVFEEAGYSLLGPVALNIAAPDEGNMHMLEAIATEDQKARYLAPLAAGDVRSCFAMTEPAPGAGSDPDALATRAERVPGGWRIDGRKWFITGADGAAFAICMARTAGEPGDRGGATMFLVDADNPGMKVGRHVPTLDESLFGGHLEVDFDGCVVPDEAVIGEVDQGYRYAQVRLGPARMTHCMRWLGIARRSQDIAVAHAAQRELFGARLADLGMAQQMIADNEIDVAAARGLILRACWELDQGRSAGLEVSMAKTFTAEAVWRVVDRSLQLCGSLGVSGDLLLGRFLREVRPFRIYDGPSETHRWSIARRVVGRHTAAARA